ncbi:MAG: tetratricopeptide repeat protein [Bacteroidales bacterium]|nr:tetratricopeptide repeat protein [Bacteroidales bacterium]
MKNQLTAIMTKGIHRFLRNNTLGNISRVLLFIIGLSLVYSCSTKRNTFTRRVYHNLTAHYNAYWNGNESLREGVEQMKNNVEDNYYEVLPVYNYGTKQQAQSLNPSMDRAIKKASKVIKLHSMRFSGEEHVRWIDDSYMLMGKAYFYKQEYISARRTFEHIVSKFPEEPIRFNAMLWIAKTGIQMEQWEKARTMLDLIKSKMDKMEIPEEVRKKLPLANAQYHILQDNFDQSIRYLKAALDYKQDRHIENRCMFILGQIYQQKEDFAQASEYYHKVVKNNPSYTLAFNARINMARSYDKESGNKELIVEELEKMLKDPKNKEYRDQIYYALAEIALRDNNDTTAINHLQKSVAVSVSNDLQKAMSSQKLAGLYFEKPNYKMAQTYYDSMMMFLPQDYPSYEKLEERTRVLTNLVDNLQVVERQDSLQKLARMPEKERKAIVDKLIAEYKAEQKRKKEQERMQQMNTSSMRGMGSRNMQRGMGSGGGKWYFYNPQALSFGHTEFVKIWGDRKLEDNWRLSTKKAMNFSSGDEFAATSDTTQSDTTELVTDPMKPETYLQYIPSTEEEMEASNQKISNALFNVGMIYKEDLANHQKSSEAFEKLVERYPEYEKILRAYYHNYKNHQRLNNPDKADHFKNKIVSQFPDSEYAKIVQNPNYFKELEKEKERLHTLYMETYNAFLAGQYDMVKMYCNDALENFEDTELKPKFEYLKALSIGKKHGKDTLKVVMNKLVSEYPDSEVAPLASDMLAILFGINQDDEGEDGENGSGKGVEEEKLKSIYNYEPKSTHFYVMLVDSRKVKVNATKVKLSDYNMKFNDLDDLNINSIILKDNWHMITINSFNNEQDAMDYYNAINNNEYVFSDIQEGEFHHFVISANNYPVFYRDKDADEYLHFFKSQYFNQEARK